MLTPGGFLNLAPLLLGLLAFSVFVRELHKKRAGGKHSLSKIGKAFLAAGILGAIGSGFAMSSTFLDAEKSKKSLAELEKASRTLNASNSEITQQNRVLIDNATHLGAQLEKQAVKIEILESMNRQLLNAARRQGVDIANTRDSARQTESSAREGAAGVKHMAELADAEAARRAHCMQYSELYKGDFGQLNRVGCGDFARSLGSGQRRCVGYDGIGGPCYTGIGGPLYAGIGGPCYDGIGGPCYSGIGGDGKKCPDVCR
jgi:hypothetical protein